MARSGRRTAAVAAGALAMLLGACATPPAGDPGHRPADRERTTADDGPRETASTRGARLVTEIVPLGAVPYDEFSLPLLDPRGRRVATQVGFAPSWATVLAEPGAPLPGGTAIEVRALAPGEPARLLHRLPSGILLGRGVSYRGFLVEQPLDDGSRRIGLCLWETGTIVWLVDDGHVNAFAHLDPDETLVWSRRAVDAPRFDLAIRWTADSAGETIVVPSQDDETWLMPEAAITLIYALRLRDGVLQAVAMRGIDGESMLASMRTVTLTNRGTPTVAYQTVASRAGAAPRSIGGAEPWTLFHPAEGRMAIWWPEEGRLRSLHTGSIAAVLLDAERVLLSLTDRVVTQSLVDGTISPPVLDGAHAIRAVDGQPWPMVLLQAGQGSVGLFGLSLTEERVRRE